MNRLKSLFISVWMTLLMTGIGRAVYQLLTQSDAGQWTFVLVALLPLLGFFTWVFTSNVARTSKVIESLFVYTVLLLGGMALKGVTNPEVWGWVAVVGVLGSALYVFWYSRFGGRDSQVLAPGKPLPALEFTRVDGTQLQTAGLNKPMLLIFYRGNWCPLCMAQIREIAGQYRQLADKGVEVMLISPQPHANSVSLAQRFDAPMTFLVDPENRMAERLGIKAENGLPLGLEALGYDSDTVMPTVLITDANATIIYADLTNNYRIRPEPDAFLEVLAKAGI